MDQTDGGGQQAIDAEAHDAVGLAAADLHESPGLGHPAMQGLHEGADGFFVPVLVQKLHGASSRGGSNWASTSQVLAAAASSMTSRAVPAWTIT